MLEGNKELYQQCADDMIPNWKSMTKNQLVRLYIQTDDERMKDGIMSAIMLKYWTKILNYYWKCKLVISPEDSHFWMVQSILYAIEHRAWENPNSTIYNDPNGPDKVINRCMESKRLTFYQQLNRYKRKINGGIASLDTIADDYKDSYIPSILLDNSIEIIEMVVRLAESNDVLSAVILDLVLNEFVYDEDGTLNKKKLSLSVRKIDDDYIKEFIDRYSIDEEIVYKGYKAIKELSTYIINRRIDYAMLKLKEALYC